MSFDYEQLIADVRLDCLSPDTHSPSDDLILQRLGDVSQLFHVELSNTSISWDTSFIDITVHPANRPEDAIYAIPEDARTYGKPVRIHTIDPTDRYHVTRKIDVIDRANIETVWQGPVVGDSRLHNAEGVILFQHFGDPSIEFVPAPQQVATYRLWFETGSIPDPILGDRIPVLPPFTRYVRVSTSALVLPYCQWSDASIPKEEWRQTRADLFSAFAPLIERWTKAWADYSTTDHQGGVGGGRGYADYFERECA